MRFVAPLLIGSICVFVACQKPAVIDLTAEETAVKALSDRWNEALRAKDVDAICPLFAENAMTLQANTRLIAGSAAICEWYRTWLLDSKVTADFRSEDFEVAASGDMAMERGVYRFRTQDADSTIEDTGKYLTVWKKVNGEWKVFCDMANTDLPLRPIP